MDLWDAPQEIVDIVTNLRPNHPHLNTASIWVLVSDGKHIVDNRLVPTKTSLCTKTEKYKTGNDFKITVMAAAWAMLTDKQREVAIDIALSKCGVKYEPQSVEVNGKKEILKDDIGRTLFTNEIQYDKNGNPKWKLNKPDAEIFYNILDKYGLYETSVENVKRVLNNEPLIQPLTAERADEVDAELETEEEEDE